MATATSVAFRDLGGSVARLPLAFTLALNDINGRYRRTILGPLWIVVAQAATIGGFVIVFSGLFQMDPRAYTVYLAAGFPVWGLLSAYLSDMPLTFIAARGFIESFELPWLTHIWRRSINYVIVFLHQLITLFVVMLFPQMHASFSWNMLFVVPALAIVMVAGSGLGMLLALFGARYRDLQPAMTVVASVLFLFTPVVWRAEQLHVNQWAVQLNPVYYYIKLLRDPLLGLPVAPEMWVGTTAGAVVIFVIGFLGFMLSRRRLYHWL